MLTSLHRICKPGRRKHKHERKERKLENSEKLSAYIVATHALPFVQQQIFMLLCLRMST